MKQITTHLLLYLLTLTSIAFSQIVRISFTGKDAQSGGVVTMDSIRITNMTLGRDTVLRNSFIIDLSIATGIGDPVVGLPGTMELTGNFANPFQDETSFRVSTIHGGTLDIGVFTLTGKREVSFRTTVAPGENSFALRSGSLAPGVYVITAQMKDGMRSVRVVKTGSTGFGEPVITHTGTRMNTARMIKSAAVTFRFIGFAKTFLPDSIFAAPLSDTTIQFSFRKSSTAPVIDQFVARTYSVGTGDPVTYDVQVRDSDGDLKSVAIDYEGDGTSDDSSAVVGSTATKTFTKSFQQAGSYRAEIRALDEKGNSTKGTLPQAVIVQGSAPALTTTSVSNITTTTATSGGMISSDGGSPISVRGVCWSTANNPTINDAKTSDGTGTGSFSSNLTGLSPNTKYYVRAYATNSAGTNYGNEVSFTTQGQMPQLSTSSVTNISTTTATSGGTITSDGGSAITARGICWSTGNNPTINDAKTNDGTGTGSFSSSLSGLTPNTKYYVRAYAMNSAGTNYGNEVSFTTQGQMPALTTAIVTNITKTSATSGGTITSDGGSAITARGVCWSTSPSPTILNSKTTDSSGTGSFVSNITGILPDSLYYIRAYAANGVGTAYGNELSFNTLPSASYDTVKIGNQVWMLKNLNVATYRNGDTIPEVTDPTEWKRLKNTGTGARCYYFNDPSLDTAYGKLYNWFAVNDPRGLAPAGWHIPTEAEWATLITFLGGEAVAGGNMKETGTVHWKPGNLGATNSSGFTALPGGSRNGNGSYHNLNKEGYWWSSTMSDSFFVWSRVMVNYDASALRYDESDISGISVRCIRGDKPSLTTDSVTSITQTTATSGGTITSDGGLPVTERGVCWSTNPAPSISANKTSSGSGTGSFMSNITGLSANTKYYVRAYATNSAGTSYGNERTFTTQQAVFYDTVLIGSQVWMRSNLNVSTYRNGDPITHVPDTSQWENLTTGAWCYYRNNATTGAVYGKLYNWYAVNDPRGLAPEGWHVATDAEWTTLTTYLGGENDAGGKLKEAGGSHWDPPNTAATNSSGFTALPGGYLNADMNFYDLRRQGVWWTATEDDASRAWSREIRYNQSEIRREWATKSAGLSVRCVKD